MASIPVTRQSAREAFRKGNNAGRGYQPNGDEVDGVVADAVAFERCTLVFARQTSDDVAVLRAPGERYLAVGGDAMGRNAWVVDITRDVEARAAELIASDDEARES